MSQSVAYRHYLRALSRFPKDNLRPETQLQDFIRKRIDKTFQTRPIDAPVSASTTSTAAAATVSASTEKFSESKELEQVNALYSLIENRYQRKYAPTNSLMRPVSNPTYYTDLVKELEAAPTRGFWDRVMNKWKGLLRLQ